MPEISIQPTNQQLDVTAGLRIIDYHYKPTIQHPVPYYRSSGQEGRGIVQTARNIFGTDFPAFSPGAWTEFAVNLTDPKEEPLGGSLDTTTQVSRRTDARGRRRFLFGAGSALLLVGAGFKGIQIGEGVVRKLTGNEKFSLFDVFKRWLLKGPEITTKSIEMDVIILSQLLTDQSQKKTVFAIAQSLIDASAETIKTEDKDFQIDERKRWKDTSFEKMFFRIKKAIDTLLIPRDRFVLKNQLASMKNDETKGALINEQLEAFEALLNGNGINLEKLLVILRNKYHYTSNDMGLIYAVYNISTGVEDPRSIEIMANSESGTVIGFRNFLGQYR